ncbi:MAG TPA: RsmG family class I SAM-dependent methyltransferase [Pyrinomonadaceae bacterium]|nr:RsmG family class I SAM-dependent methyltransferase [Pyrinomonadaceae bacterium]
METTTGEFTEAVGRAAAAFGLTLRESDIQRLAEYYALVMKWNPRLHLIAPCSPQKFATRHILESLLLLKHLPLNASIVDVGSGAGVPAIPCLLVRADLTATLIESSQKKGVFLREALRAVRPSGRTHLTVARFQDVPSPRADFVTCRALDRFGAILPKLVQWAPNATFLLFAGDTVRKRIESLFSILQLELIPQSQQRFLITARRTIHF